MYTVDSAGDTDKNIGAACVCLRFLTPSLYSRRPARIPVRGVIDVYKRQLLRSGDDGRTFGEESIILTCEGEGGVNAMSLSLMHMKNGDIGLFYLVRTTYTLLRMFLRRSRDGGRTWGERVLCTPQEGFFVVNNDRVIRLSDDMCIRDSAGP